MDRATYFLGRSGVGIPLRVLHSKNHAKGCTLNAPKPNAPNGQIRTVISVL